MPDPETLVHHGPIAILNDSNLLEQAAAEGWPGTGAENDPIVIQGLNITADSFHASFYAQNVRLHMLVRNCVFVAEGFDGNATALLNVSNMEIENAYLRSYNALVGIECFDIAVHDCTLVGGSGNSSGEGGYAVSFTNASNLTVSGNVLTQEVWSRLYFFNVTNFDVTNNTIEGANLALIDSFGIDVADNVFSNSETFGIYIWASGMINITRNEFIGGKTGILIYEDAMGPSLNVSLSWNTFDNSGILFQAGPLTLGSMTSNGDTINGKALVILKDLDLHGGIYSANAGEYLVLRVSNGTMANMDVEGNNAMYLCGCDDLLVENGSFSNIEGCGIGLVLNQGVEIRNCSFNNINDAIWCIGDNTDTTIADCVLTDCVVAISDALSHGTSIIGNHIVGSHSDGISATSVIDCSILNNTISDSERNAMILGMSGFTDVSENVSVEGNIISACSVGMDVTGAVDSRFTSNAIDNASDIGIMLVEANENSTFTFNTIRWCTDYAVKVMTTSEEDLSNDRNCFYSNAFTGNNGAGSEYSPEHCQVSDEHETNTSWAILTDKGMQGNYWSDLTGPDVNHDGFVDVPYEIADNVSDARPFASLTPYEPSSVKGEAANGQARITWATPAFQGMKDVVRYEVLRGDGKNWTHLAFVTGTEYLDKNVSAGVSYQYEIRAINEYGNGLMSDPVTVELPQTLGIEAVLLLLAAIVVIGLALAVIWISRKK